MRASLVGIAASQATAEIAFQHQHRNKVLTRRRGLMSINEAMWAMLLYTHAQPMWRQTFVNWLSCACHAVGWESNALYVNPKKKARPSEPIDWSLGD